MNKAVAVRYDPEYPAPFVLAKGQGDLARRIVEMAELHGVAVEKRGILTDALYEIEIGDLIPEELYRVVAEVLVFVAWVDSDVHDARNTKWKSGK